MAVAFAATRVPAKPKRREEDPAFASRLAALKKDAAKLIVVNMTAPGDPPPASGPVLVASSRSGIYTPEILSDDDIRAVIAAHLADVRRCFKKQLEADPDWNDELILDLAIKRNGRVSEVSVEPDRVRTEVVGTCLMSAVPRWRFPEFSGEVEEGIVREVVNASFPLQLSR